MIAPIATSFVRSRHVTRQPVPATGQIDGLQVYYPKAWYLPRVGRPLNAWLYALSTRSLIARLRPFDIILVNWAYPDACGIAQVARQLGVPFVASCSGSDLNVGLTFRIRRHQILRMIGQARATTVRSRALKELLVCHGAIPSKIHVLYNGVDGICFRPHPRTKARRSLGLDEMETVLAYVGRLSEEKGVADLLDALALLRNRHNRRPRLLIVGDGPQRLQLLRQAQLLRLEQQILWLGMKPNDEIAPLLSAADIACVPSHMEGVPNAALEAFACGVPVVGTKVGGIPEVVTAQTGLLAEPRQPESLTSALAEALGRCWDSKAILAHAARFDWNANARALYDILEEAAA